MRQRKMVFGVISLSLMLSVMLVVTPAARPSTPTGNTTWSLSPDHDQDDRGSQNRYDVCKQNHRPRKCPTVSTGGVAATVTFDVPGAALTWAFGINNADAIVGYYQDATAGAAYHGFIHQGTSYTTGFTTVDVPGSILTYAQGINDLGDIVGIYEDAAGTTHGFLHHGTDYTQGYLTINVPGAECCISPNGIANDGTIAGTYGGKGHIRGFRHAGTDLTTGYSTIDYASATVTSTDTVANAIDRSGGVAGYYFDQFGKRHGFVLRSGTFSTVDAPGTLVPAPMAGTTQVYGTNSLGVVVGYYLDSGFQYDAFQAQGTTFKVVTVGTGNIVFAYGINENGDVVGEVYNSATAKYHGFAIIAATGTAAAGTATRPTGRGDDDDENHHRDNDNDNNEHGEAGGH
ncbi:MAG: hypothetical protein E6H00_13780 [Bacillati bacterium ANGP1]|uniref:DUF3466 family protein n=1 Tax=Candidatus Segetimicrobium genomatis TaxID=2569760 RepID=A0A537JWW2_9BACT|nr:MAG: hypothetical protein E6H00_13780 [Terrabacteria group bacterium ANGP1]